MSEEMKSIEGLRSSDVFDLTAVGFPAYWSGSQVRVCGRALRNYDEAKDKADRLTSDLSATQELLRLKELECEQLANDKKGLVDALGKIVSQKDKYTPTQQGKGVRVRRIREFDLDEAKQLLEQLK